MDVDGKNGLFPHIPPNATLTFDITLLEYRPRSTWIKPLIQDLQSTNEKPYLKDLKISLEKAHQLGLGHRIAEVLSSSLLLNEGLDYSVATAAVDPNAVNAPPAGSNWATLAANSTSTK